MAFRVVVMPSAQSDLEDHYELIARDSINHARRWFTEAWQLIFSLQDMPTRFAVIAESEEVGVELRQIVHYSHRIIYKVDEAEGSVEVLRVWHQARRAIGNADLN